MKHSGHSSFLDKKEMNQNNRREMLQQGKQHGIGKRINSQESEREKKENREK